MAELNQLKTHENYLDASLVKVPGPDGSIVTYQYDEQQRAFYTRESALPFAGRHGTTHISTDPIPTATCTTPGLMSADDKCRLDTLMGTRIGVLGFTGAGFPDDGGFMDGDVILAAGSEYISLERVGNVVRFVVDIPAVYSCGTEDCQQIYWIRDETDVAAIRPPANGGKLFGTNVYGEMKIYLFPENTIINPANPSTLTNIKPYVPTFVFKRYDDGTGTNEGEIDLVLKRNDAGTATVGWGFTPGSTGKAEWQVFLGVDDDNSRISFKLDGNTTPGILGALLYNGHVITKRSAVITGYHSSVVSTNIYMAKWWDINNKTDIGDAFAVTNQPQWDLSGDIPVLDAATDSLLLIGQIIDVWSFKVGETNGVPAYVHYCRERPPINASNLWITLSAVQFGDTLLDETSESVSDLKTLDPNTWGSAGINDALNLYVDASTVVLNQSGQVSVIPDPPCIEVVENPISASDQEVPVLLWHKASLRDAYIEAHFAAPNLEQAHVYPPIDVLLRAPMEAYSRRYLKVIGRVSMPPGGSFDSLWAIVVEGVPYNEIPQSGLLRQLYLSGDYEYGQVYRYMKKLLNYGDGHQVLLIMEGTGGPFPTDGSIVEVMPQEFKAPALRLQFGETDSYVYTMQPRVGILDMAAAYRSSDANINDLAADFMPGYMVGNDHTQDGYVYTDSTGVTTSPEGFIVYEGAGNANEELYNILRVKVEDNKIWVWWNNLLCSPNSAACAVLATPVDVTSPYYPFSDVVQYGKFGLRLWPGARLRRFIVRSKPVKFSEFTLGQLEVG